MRLAASFMTSRQRGAATLVVVMMLFLVMALLAAYANRNLMFEQRMASGYTRGSLSQEVAEGGIEWTLAQLNGPAIDTACKPQSAGGQRFVDRYLSVDPTDRSYKLVQTYNRVTADCTRDLVNEGWACRCPAIPTRTRPAAMGGATLTPSFGIQFVLKTTRSGTFQVKSVACTDSVVDNCAISSSSAINRSQGQLAVSTFTATIALVSAVRNPPAAPLIVKGNVDMTGTGLGLHNTDPRSAGSLLAIGGDWSGLNEARMQSVPGTAPELARIKGDQTLSTKTADDVFKMFMGAAPSRYEQHPSLRTVTCSGDCAGTLEEAYAAGKRILWVNGPLIIRSDKTLGSVSDPVLVIATDVTIEGPFQLNGMLVARGDLSWSNDSGLTSLVTGIVLVGGRMQTTGSMDISYQQAVADQLRNRMGSYVRVPGGWIDND